jgi:translocation and assembly module TamB
MRRVLRWIARSTAVLAAVLVVLVAALSAGANTDRGRAIVARLVPRLTGGLVTVRGLSGRLPDRLAAAEVSLRDKDGVWARIDGLSLDWSPLRLFAGVVGVDRLMAARIAVLRRPMPSSGGSSRMVPVDIENLHIGRLDLARTVTGTAASLAVDGSAALAVGGEAHVDLAAAGLDAPGNYRLRARLGAADLDVRLSGEEPAHGLVATIAGLPDLGPLSVDVTFVGPRSAVAGQLLLALGPARIAARGTLDLERRSVDFVATARAPAMAPRADLGWHRIIFDGRIAGLLARPTVSARLNIAAVRAAQTSVADITARIEGDAGALRFEAALTGIRIPGPRPDLFGATPLRIAAEAQLDRAGRPVQFSLAHPLITAKGTVWTAGPEHATVAAALPDLAPLAALAGLDLDGHAALDLTAAMRAGTTRLDGNGTVGITGGTAPAAALVGNAAHLAVSGSVSGANVTISRFEFAGRKVSASAAGHMGAKELALHWRLTLPDLTSAVPTLAGVLRLEGRLSGPTDDLAASADLAGTVGPIGRPSGPLKASIRLAGLPGTPTGRVNAEGLVLGSPLRLGLAALRSGDGGFHLAIEQADWKSAHAEGVFAVPVGTRFPLGRIEFRMTRLADLAPLLGRPIAGAFAGSLVTAQTGGRQRADLRLAADNLGFAGADAHAEVDATVLDPLSRPLLDARIAAAGRAASGATASARIQLKGPEAALAFSAQSEIQDPNSGNVRFAAAGSVDAVTRVAAVEHLEAGWHGQELRLLAPARVGFGNGLTLDHLDLRLGQGTIAANGRLTPTLDLTVALRGLPAGIASAFAPGLDADGTIQGDARFTGTLQRPQGHVRLTAAGLRLRNGSARALPAADLDATADIAGPNARLDARLTAGPSANLSIEGRVSAIPSTPVALNAAGAVDLEMFDPLLTASGRRATGKVAFDARIGGTLQAPLIDGTARLTDGAIDDFGLGLHLTEITGLVEATGRTIRLARLEGHAGRGTIGLAGTVALSAPGMPVDLQITARNARPLATDLLTATLNADMSLRGHALGRLALGGRVEVLQANVGIPKSMPAAVPVLDVRVAGAPAPPPSAPPPSIGLDLTVAAHRIVVSGRGLFAELAGTLKVGGTTAAPQPLGGFHLVRGNLEIAGQTLDFDSGEVSFNGGSLTDPSLHFVVTSLTSTMSAQLVITGTASHPKVAVTSTPELPADEALARMLYPNSNATPSPLQLASIAASLAELSGATGGAGPLSGIQQGLGLEQLSVGTATNGSAALQVGRYVRPGVWVGAQQGAGANSSQARVEIDIARGLKVFGTVGNGSNTTPGATPAQSAGTSLGLKYQFQY